MSVTRTVDPDALIEAETTIRVSEVRLLELLGTEDGTAEEALAGQYVVANVLVRNSVRPAEFVEVETSTPDSVVRPLGLKKVELADLGPYAEE